MGHPILKPTEIDAIGAATLRVLDAPRRKSDYPIKPMITEFIGKPKAGKDRQLVNMERLVKRLGFLVVVHQEGAETEDVRRVPRDFSFAMQLKYLVQALDRMLHAAVHRDFHMIFFNRGVLDVLYWLEFQIRQGLITRQQHEITKSFIMQGPWVEALDTVICLSVSVERALEREYGADFRSRKIKFGRMMSPEGLTLMSECVDHVCNYLAQELPQLPLFVIDTTDQTESETEAHIASIIFTELQQRLKIDEDQILPWSIDLMREKAWVSGPEIKFRGTVNHEILRKHGWCLEASTRDTDEYLVPHGEVFDGGECFHIRTNDASRYLIYKRQVAALHRPKIPVPITAESAEELRHMFDTVGVVRKTREVFLHDGIVLHKDTVEDLGEFVEIKGRMGTSEEEIIAFASKLGLHAENIVPETYIRCTLKHQKRT